MERDADAGAAPTVPLRNGFRMRGTQLSRIEGLTDAAFALALTHLVISIGRIPQDYAELLDALKRIPAFATTFLLIAPVWAAQVRWCRRYGMDDAVAIACSCLLILVVLVFVFPLKIVFASFFNWVSGGWLPAEMALSSNAELSGQFVIYAVGYAAVSLSVALLFELARRRRRTLDLSALELHDTVTDLQQYLLLAGISLGVAAAILALPPRLSMWPMFGYSLLAAALPLHGTLRQRSRPAAPASRSAGLPDGTATV